MELPEQEERPPIPETGKSGPGFPFLPCASGGLLLCFVFLILWIGIGCSSPEIRNTTNIYPNCQEVTPPPFPAEKLSLIHWLPPDGEARNPVLHPGSPAGGIAPVPIRVSEKYHGEFMEALELYSRREFDTSLDLLWKIEQSEPENLFVVEQIARTFQAMGNPSAALVAYRHLQKLIRQKNPEKEGELLDLWFLDACRETGNLYMEAGDPDSALLPYREYFDFSVLIHAPGDPKTEGELVHTALQLTRIYFRLRQKEANRYFYCKTLELAPDNSEVRSYLIPRGTEELSSIHFSPGKFSFP